MLIKQLKTWLKLAEPLGSPSKIKDPNLIAVTASKKLALKGKASADLMERAYLVKTPQECAAILSECLKCLEKTPESDYLTIKQVAAMLNVCARTIRRRVYDGSFPEPIKFGRNVRWRKLDIENYNGTY